MVRQRKLNRLKGWDYSSQGFYFITICSKYRRELFGKIVGKNMILNKFGKLVVRVLCCLPKRFGVYLDRFVVMPNHIHFVIYLNVGAIHESPVPKKIEAMTHGLPVPKKIKGGRSELSKIIGYFKMNVAKQMHIMGFEGQVWQRNYHDHVVRNRKELDKIRWYITDNPKLWFRDRNRFEEYEG